MPYHKKKYAKKAPHRGRKAGRRRYKKARANKRITTVRVPGGAIIPDRTFVKLKYTETEQDLLAANNSAYGFLSWRFNGMYDPSSAIGTYYPVGFTAYASLYERYWVRGNKINLEISNMQDFPVMVVVWPSAYQSTPSVNANYLQWIISNTYSQHRLLSAKGGMDRARITMYMSTKKVVGNRVAITDALFSALTNTNPTRLLQWNVGVYPLNSSDTITSNSIPFELRMTYYTEFYDRRELTPTLTGDIDDDGVPISPI